MSHRHQAIIEQVGAQLRPLLNDLFAAYLGPTHSQAYWERLAEIICGRLNVQLSGNPELMALAEQGDIRKSNGKLNTEAMMAVFEQEAKEIEGPHGPSRLTFLAQHMRHTLTQIGMLKRKKGEALQ